MSWVLQTLGTYSNMQWLQTVPCAALAGGRGVPSPLWCQREAAGCVGHSPVHRSSRVWLSSPHSGGPHSCTAGEEAEGINRVADVFVMILTSSW